MSAVFSSGSGDHPSSQEGVVPADAIHRFRIYLNDHRGLLAAEGAVAERSRQANAGELGRLLHRVVEQNTRDQTVVDELLDRVGGTANPLKKFGALAGERVGRLKLNGQLKGYSPLSRVIEIESLLASTAVRRVMWQAISGVAIDDAVANDALMRSESADEQLTELGPFHLEASLTAFGAAP